MIKKRVLVYLLLIFSTACAQESGDNSRNSDDQHVSADVEEGDGGTNNSNPENTKLPDGVNNNNPENTKLPDGVESDDFSDIGPSFFMVTKGSEEVSEADLLALSGQPCEEASLGLIRYASSGISLLFVCSPEFNGMFGSQFTSYLRSRKKPMWVPIHVGTVPTSASDVTKAGWYLTRDSRHDAYEVATIFAGDTSASLTLQYSTIHPNVEIRGNFCSEWVCNAYLPRGYEEMCSTTDENDVNYLNASNNFGNVFSEYDSSGEERIYVERNGVKVEIPLVFVKFGYK